MISFETRQVTWRRVTEKSWSTDAEKEFRKASMATRRAADRERIPTLIFRVTVSPFTLSQVASTYAAVPPHAGKAVGVLMKFL
jgi:hypothetical protein